MEYSEQSKAYQIYIPRYRQIELSRDVTFDEDPAFRKSRKDKEDEEEHETPKTFEGPKEVRVEEEDQIPEEHDMTEPQLPEYLPNELNSRKRKPTWDREVIEEAKRHGAPEAAIKRERSQSHIPVIWP